MLFMTLLAIKSNASLTVYYDYGQGTTYGYYNCTENYDSIDSGIGQADLYILGGLTVYYNINLGYDNGYNYNGVYIYAPSAGWTFCRAETDNPSGKQYWNGSFYWPSDDYLNITMLAVQYAPSGIDVNVNWQ